MTDKPTLDYEGPRNEAVKYLLSATGLITFGLIFIGGSIVTGLGAVSVAIAEHGPGWLVVYGGMLIVLCSGTAIAVGSRTRHPQTASQPKTTVPKKRVGNGKDRLT